MDTPSADRNGRVIYLATSREGRRPVYWRMPVVPESADKNTEYIGVISPERPLVCDTCCERVALIPCNSIVANDYRLSGLVMSLVALLDASETIVNRLKRLLHR